MSKRSSRRKRRWKRNLLIATAAEGIPALMARRRGIRLGSNTIVRCGHGHLFTTIWIPGVSFKAARLGLARFQRCPVGPHWSIVRPVREADLAPDELAAARAQRDVRIP